MSDTDDELRASINFSSVFALAAMESGEGSSSTGLTATHEKVKTIAINEYQKPKKWMVLNNRAVKDLKLVEKTAAYLAGKGTMNGAMITGTLAKQSALDLYESALVHMNPETGGAKMEYSVGRKNFVTFAPGFHQYDQVVGGHDAEEQRRATVVLDFKFLEETSKTLWPELHDVYFHVQKHVVGNYFKVVVAHILCGRSLQVAFEYHHDSEEHKMRVDLSFVAELGNSHSTMNIAGEKEMVYRSPGSWAMFDAQMMHRSGESYADTMKIARSSSWTRIHRQVDGSRSFWTWTLRARNRSRRSARRGRRWG